jgi:2-oxoglutarate dehydrogenase E2 component (dihydrolipoamide succinyltransferase)
MPQMGESIAEGTITKWLKKVGDRVERDEPLFEISTDKVDAEIPSPAAGTLTEIKFKEGETVEVNTVVAVLDGADGAGTDASAGGGQAGVSAPASQAAVSAPTPPPPPSQAPPATPAQQGQTAQTASTTQPSGPPPPPPAPTPTPPKPSSAPAAATASQAASGDGGERSSSSSSASAQSSTATAGGAQGNGREQTAEELRRTRSSPLVRNIAREHGIDISRLEGTGMSGRVTKNDILSFIESGAALRPQEAMQTGQTGQMGRAAPEAPASTPAPAQAPATAAAATMPPAAEDRVEQMSVMRRKIADHMVMSRRTSAHVTTVYEIDMTRIARLREQHRAAFQERTGTKLTFMPFIFQAVTSAIRKFPIFNAQVNNDQIIYKRDINLGMAVALDWGLIVPVIKRADDLSISGLARAANDLAERARSKQLKPDEVAGGTFTITNPGVFGGLFGTPIINQPQVAILGVGAIEKRPKVLTTPDGDELIAIRSMAYFALSFDHRIIDGADAEKFLAYVKELLEAGQFAV